MLKKTEMKMKRTIVSPFDLTNNLEASRTTWQLAALGSVALAAGFLLSGCKTATPSEDAPTVTVQVGAAENQPIQLKVISDGVLYPRDQAAIVPKVIAPVKKFYVQRGSPVKKDQLLAELENQDLAGAHQKSQGVYVQAQVTYDMEVQKVAQDAKLAKQTLDSAQKLYDSRQALYKEGAISAKDVEDANVALTQARNAYDLAQKQFDLRGAEGQVKAAGGDLASAEAQVSYTKIVSPIDGVVTDRPNYAGETPAAGAPLITVMDLSEVVARVHISQMDASRLKAGDEASIRVPGQGPAIKARVTLVSPALDPNSTTVEVWVQAPNPGGRMKPGVSARVTMIAQTVPKAIVAPAAALLTATDGVTSMIVLDTDNKPHKKKVTVGIRDGGDVQITEGLQGGERVVTVGAFELDKMDDMTKATIQVQSPKMPDEEEDQ
jgi:HlyD family secretion protein